jgi:hypothetical protein
VKLQYVFPFSAVKADIHLTDSTRARTVLFKLRNEINPVGAGHISLRAKTVAPRKLPNCRVIRYSAKNEYFTAQQTIDLNTTVNL